MTWNQTTKSRFNSPPCTPCRSIKTSKERLSPNKVNSRHSSQQVIPCRHLFKSHTMSSKWFRRWALMLTQNRTATLTSTQFRSKRMRCHSFHLMAANRWCHSELRLSKWNNSKKPNRPKVIIDSLPKWSRKYQIDWSSRNKLNIKSSFRMLSRWLDRSMLIKWFKCSNSIKNRCNSWEKKWLR